ncbi:MAG: aldehyde dehydrogenase family protein [Kouleothrix sp.]
MIAFTGSFATGREIARLAAERVKRTHPELGGKDVHRSRGCRPGCGRAGVAWAALLNAGQVAHQH